MPPHFSHLFSGYSRCEVIRYLFLVFCYQNCCVLLLEKRCSSDWENFWNSRLKLFFWKSLFLIFKNDWHLASTSPKLNIGMHCHHSKLCFFQILFHKIFPFEKKTNFDCWQCIVIRLIVTYNFGLKEAKRQSF